MLCTGYKIDGLVHFIYWLDTMSTQATRRDTPVEATRRYTAPAPAPLPDDYDEFYASLTDAERELDALAKELLGSSYIIQWTNMYIKWRRARGQSQQSQQSQGT